MLVGQNTKIKHLKIYKVRKSLDRKFKCTKTSDFEQMKTKFRSFYMEKINERFRIARISRV